MPPIKKLQRTSLAAQSYEVFREVLLRGKRFRPGQKISVEEISRELGVSRSPVWDAIARLEAEGLLEVVPRQGVFVLSLDADRIRELFSARAALEGTAVREAAARIVNDDVSKLTALIQEQKVAARQRDGVTYNKLSLDFSIELLRIAGNRTIEKLLTSIYAQTQAQCGHMSVDQSAVNASIAAHEKILSALKQRNGERAEQAVHSHISQLADAIEEFAEESR